MKTLSTLPPILTAVAFGILATTASLAQQTPDLGYAPPIGKPAFPQDRGPRVAIDEAHGNFHTVDGRYRPFAELLRRDGFRVESFKSVLTKPSLSTVDVLVIANPLHESNREHWALPTPSAYTPEEIRAVVEWIHAGGSLLLIADHMPFPGAAQELAKAFGVEFSNGYARSGNRQQRSDVFRLGDGLIESPVTKGRPEDPDVTAVATFGGSAFKLPGNASPILVFGEGSISRETTKAPGITPDAPEVPVAGWSQGAVLEKGQGRVAIFGEAAMFSAQHSGPAKLPMGMNAPEAKQNHQLVLNLLRWLAANKNATEAE